MPFEVVRGDITRMKTDAIVNAANSRLQQGGGVCGAIFAAAGARQLQAECDALGGCPTGQAVITGGGSLPARYIIHTVGPVWRGGGCGEPALLRSCYLRSLELARSRGLRSVAFPLISAGIYGYPRPEALAVAGRTSSALLEQVEMRVLLVFFDRASFDIGRQRFDDIAEYIDDRTAETALRREYRRRPEGGLDNAPLEQSVCSAPLAQEDVAPRPLNSARAAADAELARRLAAMDESFSQALLRLIDERGMTDVACYKRANIDRKLFSKIRSDPAYRPSKATAAAFAVALELDFAGAQALLGKAGFTLSNSSKFDIILGYFLDRPKKDIYAINEVLFAFDQPLLGG